MQKIKIQAKNNEKTIAEGYVEFIRRCKVKNLKTASINYYDRIYHLIEIFGDVNSNIKEIDVTDGLVLKSQNNNDNILSATGVNKFKIGFT